ncbi:centrosomal protein of 19 kDa-like [Tigriopus californicus]|uniref:centrosomal protein of 19 kDa-like n=1 Tax=Tigriopus californicus TaxID=6832 RepID=UPI0027DA5094|nr:centrosomal protein of 19 kDa-like [Tigriopus californicus]
MEALEIGVSFKHSFVVLKYRHVSSGLVRKRSMPVRNLTKSSDCYAEAGQLKKRHDKYLRDIPTVRIEKMIKLLQDTMKGKSLVEALAAAKMDFSINFDEDMNKLTDQELQRRKELMDVTFQKKQVKAGDPDFIYDKQVDFSDAAKLESGWDSQEAKEEEEDFWS